MYHYVHSLHDPPFIIMVSFVGQSAAMCPKPKNLKHFLLEVLVGDLGMEVEGLESLGFVPPLHGIIQKF